MNPRNPMFSRIEMAQGSGAPADDGRLEVHELLAMRIHAPLVFLSGCETGVASSWSTEFSSGEDYSTLAQGFMYAGAQSVIATLWRIEDEGAAALAERFYANLKGDGSAGSAGHGPAGVVAELDLPKAILLGRLYAHGSERGRISFAQKSDGVR